MTSDTILIGFIGGLGPLEIVFILAVLVLLFGRKLPDIARNMGKSLTEFKKGIKESEHDLNRAIDDADRQASRQASGSDDFTPKSDNKG